MVVFFLYLVRVYFAQGWYIVSYAYGIYLLNQLIGFLSPQVALYHICACLCRLHCYHCSCYVQLLITFYLLQFDPDESNDDMTLPTCDSDEFRSEIY